jgi:hypothetical protein
MLCAAVALCAKPSPEMAERGLSALRHIAVAIERTLRAAAIA